MPIPKYGEPNKIVEIAKTAEQFASMWGTIEKKNDLVKCTTCGHLLSKRGEDGSLTLKHKKVSAIIKGEFDVVCPVCTSVNRIK